MASASRPDPFTLVAIAVLAYAIANVAHEGVGHGGACVLVGARPVALNAVYFDCDWTSVSPMARKLIAAGGTVVNLLLAALSAVALRGTSRRAGSSGPLRHFLWLLLTLNLLQATGYWLFSGVASLGDWVVAIEGWTPHAAWRALLALAGAAGYLGSIVVALRTLSPLVGSGPDRIGRAVRLTVIPYLTGGALYVAAGLWNPGGLALVFLSAVPASFGGASALAWMAQLLRNGRRWLPPPVDCPPLPRARAWIAAGVVAAVVFVGVLGPGIAFGTGR